MIFRHETPCPKNQNIMAKIVSKGHKTWKDGSMMTYTISDEGVLTLSGKLIENGEIDIRSKASFRHLVIDEGIEYIGRYNFQWFDIEELTLPSTLKVIRKYAFNKCENLKKIHFSEGLEVIGEESFYECRNLEELQLPKTVTTISPHAFCFCTNLREVSLPAGIKSVEHGVFKWCKDLKSVNLGREVAVIGNDAFHGCTSLEHIKFPKSVNRIGDNAFDGCEKLQNVILPNEKISLGTCAFGKEVGFTFVAEDGNEYHCCIEHIKTNRSKVSISGESIVVGDAHVPEQVGYDGKSYPVTTIEQSAFSGFDKLISITLPDSIEYIGDTAFLDCKNLESVELGQSLKHIGIYAFDGCYGLRNINLPESLECLGSCALCSTKVFENSKGVLYLNHVLCGYAGDFPEHSYLETRSGTTVVAERAFTSKSRLEGVIFNEGLKHIGYCAFVECEDLKYVKFPKSLISIGADAFGYTAIEEVVAPWKKPIKIGYQSFPESTVIYIPKGTMEAYSQAECWNNYKLVER